MCRDSSCWVVPDRSREKCEAQRHNDFDDAAKAAPGNDARERALWESSRNAMCVSAADPRLKQ
jgi:hypothetical protein